MDKGFVIMAQNTKSTNYVKCAKVLSDSIMRYMPDANVTIITTKELPYGDLDKKSNWKLINDWQVYEASPYTHTIKLEADMIITQNIDYWWDVLEKKDVVVCNTIRNYKGEISDFKFYRKFIYDNELPDVYNAITYFKKSEFAETFFKTVRTIFENWNDIRSTLVCNVDEPATTDWVYALACHIHGIENTTIPIFTDMSMVHMKQHINDLSTENWTNELVYELLPECVRVNTFVQNYPFHYHVKKFSSIIEKAYG
jgi:hypothetical protein